MNYYELVQELNSEIFDNHGDIEEQWFYTSSGFVDIIGFGDISLWDSENSERKWNEEKKEYEPMKPFLKRTLKEYGKKLTKLSK